MPFDVEKKDLINQDKLAPVERAKLNYRVAQKLRTKLSEIKDINETLNLLPEKNARRVLNDDLVNAVLTLAEDMIRILGYGPLKIDDQGYAYTTRTTSTKTDDKRSMIFTVTADLANDSDLSRKMLVEDHISTLNHLMSQNLGLLSDTPANIDCTSISNNLDPVNANFMLEQWGRPRVKNYNRTIGFGLPKNRLIR